MALSLAETKSPLKRSTGIDTRFVNVSAAGISDASAKMSLNSSYVLPLVFPKFPDILVFTCFLDFESK